MTLPTDGLFDRMLALLISTSLRGAFVVGLGALACAVLGRRSAGLRHAIWCAVLAACVLLPLAGPWAPSWRIPLALPAAPAPAHATMDSADLGPAPATSAASSSTRAPTRAPDAGTVTVLLWAAVALVLLARLAAAHVRLAALVRRSGGPVAESWQALARDAARALGLPHAPRLLVSDELSMPIVAGVLRPSVVLPRSSDAWHPACRREVLLHELAHVHRGDLPWLTLARIVSAVFWFHPLVRLACRRLRSEAELASDDRVLRAGEVPSRYAETLLELSVAPAARPLAGVPLLRREHLSERIESIVAANHNRSEPGPRLRAAFAIGAAVVAVLAASPRLERSGARAAVLESQVFAGRVIESGSGSVLVLGVRVRSTRLAAAKGGSEEIVRLDAPELDLDNPGDRAIGSVFVRLETPGVSVDRFWYSIAIAPHSRAVLRIPPSHWSNDVLWSRARRFQAGVTDARAPRAPQEEPESAPPQPAPAPAAEMPVAEAPPRKIALADGERFPAEALNPAGAPVVIRDAWTPRRLPPPSSNEAERAMDRGHALTYLPSFTLHNTSTRTVVGVRLRFKAAAESHAVTVLQTPIAPGQTLTVPPGRSIWGTPRAMKIQILGVRFSDGSVWGTLDSTIDARQVWIR